MKLLFLNPAAQLGGAERVLLDMIACLRDDAAISVILAEEGPLVSEARRAGAQEVIVLPLCASLRKFGEGASGSPRRWTGRIGLALRAALALPAAMRYATQLRSAIERIGPDIVHSNGMKMHALGALAMRRDAGARLVWHIHDFLGQRSMMSRVLRRYAGPVSAAIAISDAVARDVRVQLPATPVETLLNAIDVEHFSTGAGDGAQLDRLAGFSPTLPEVVRVGLVATYAKWKGHDVFIDAAARVTNPNVRFYIVGGPIYATAGSQFSRAELEARAARMGIRSRLGFVDFQDDPRDVYRALDVVVHASTKPEPFGRTIVEAMACGRAMIVSAAGGALELFEHNVNAIGVSPGDVAALSAAIDRLATDAALRENLGDRAAAHAREKFNRRRLRTHLLQIYRKAMAGR